VTYQFGVTNFDGDSITVDYEVGTTQETAAYTVSSSGALSFNAANSTVTSDPFGFTINSTATAISGVVPGPDTVESVTITVSAASGKQTQTANGGDPIVIQAIG
jgi:hypothetical protein